MHAIAIIFLIMIILMGISFLTFEIRTKDSKTLANVAMLSSLSAASRIFFAPLAQITPSDWITFSVGFCFGPSAGFVVGALTILISNFVLGHGVWTIFQMFALGLIGIIGGVIGKFTQKWKVKTYSLLLAACAFLYDYITNIWFLLFLPYPKTLEWYLIICIMGFKFDMMHAIGNFLFMYVFSENTFHILERYRKQVNIIQI